MGRGARPTMEDKETVRTRKRPKDGDGSYEKKTPESWERCMKLHKSVCRWPLPMNTAVPVGFLSFLWESVPDISNHHSTNRTVMFVCC